MVETRAFVMSVNGGGVDALTVNAKGRLRQNWSATDDLKKECLHRERELERTWGR